MKRFHIKVKCSCNYNFTINRLIINPFFFYIWVFFHEHSWITGLQKKGEGISLTPHCHFHSLHKHLDISRVTNAESSPLHIGTRPDSNQEPLVSEQEALVSKCKSLTTKLCALYLNIKYLQKDSNAYFWCLTLKKYCNYSFSVCS